MFIQQTYKNNLPTVYFVGTPIGNLGDFSFRGIEVLSSVSVICCEDTRTSQTLLKKYNIKAKLISLHKFNEIDRAKEIREILSNGNNIAIISDAGAPVISDPGSVFIKELRKSTLTFNVTAVNVGPAYIHAIVASGYTNKQNYFYGFIEEKNDKSKEEELIKLFSKYNNESIISFYESVHRIRSTIQTLTKILNPVQQVVIARELTKMNEEFIYGPISEVNEFIQSEKFTEKGEFVIVVDQYDNEFIELNDSEIADKVNDYIIQGFRPKQATEIVANLINKKKNNIYTIYLKKYKNF